MHRPLWICGLARKEKLTRILLLTSKMLNILTVSVIHGIGLLLAYLDSTFYRWSKIITTSHQLKANLVVYLGRPSFALSVQSPVLKLINPFSKMRTGWQHFILFPPPVETTDAKAGKVRVKGLVSGSETQSPGLIWILIPSLSLYLLLSSIGIQLP